jgi:hypothetical protein
MAAPVKDIGTKEILTKVIDLLWTNKALIDPICKYYVADDKLMKVYRGDLKVISTYPCICVEPLTTVYEYGAANYTVSNTYNLRIFCYLKNIDREEQVNYIVDFTEAVRMILNNPDNVQWISPTGGEIYDSRITSATFGFKQGFAIRASQCDWSANSWNTQYHQGV